MSFQSVHDMLTPPGVVRKQKFWDWFSGSVLKSQWTFTDEAGTGTGAMDDGVDLGYELACGATGGNNSTITFNDIRHYDHNGCSCTIIAKSQSSSDEVISWGFIDTLSAANLAAWYHFSGDSSNFEIYTIGAGASNTDSSVALDTNFHKFRLDLDGTTTLGYLDDVLEIAKTTDPPAARLQPWHRVLTQAAGARLSNTRRWECYNT